MRDYAIATELDPEWYQAWHTWALANFEVVNQLEVSQQGLTGAHFTTYIIPAVQGFLRSITISPKNSLQDALRLLTLWFRGLASTTCIWCCSGSEPGRTATCIMRLSG